MSFEYRVHPANAVVELLSPKRFDMPDAYLASDLETDTIRETLTLGFRWVRTDGDHAIFERDLPGFEGDLEVEREERVVLLPQVLKPAGFHGAKLVGLRVEAAPPHVCSFVLQRREGEMIAAEAVPGILMELITNGYPVEIRKAEVEEAGVLAYLESSGEASH